MEGFKSLYEAADESRRIASRTENVIRTTGEAAGVSAQQVGDLAGAIAAKTGVDDEAIQSGANLLLTFTNIKNVAGDGNDIFNQATQIMTDMSAAMGTDASGSAIQLGKALNDPVKGMTALTKVGVSFTQQQKDQVEAMVAAGDTLGAQKVILGELQKEFGGAAAAMGTPMDRLKVSAGNLQEQLGGYLLPVVDKVATSLTGELGGAADQLGPQLASAAQSVADLIPSLVSMVEQGTELASNVLPLMTGSLGLLLNVADKLGPALPGIVAGFTGMRVAQTVGDGVGRFAEAIGQADGKLGSFGRGLSTVSVALPLIGGVISQVSDSMNKQDEQIKENTQRFGAYFAAVREGGNAATQAMDDYNKSFLGHIGIKIEDAPGFKEAADAAQGYLDALSPLDRASQDVTHWTNELASAAADSSYVIHDMNGNTVTLTAAQAALAGATQTQTDRQTQLDAITAAATGTTDAYTTGLQDAVDAAKDAQDATNLLKSALDALTGANVSVDQATSSYYSALDQAKASLGDLGGEIVASNGLLNLQSAAGQEVSDRLITLGENSHSYLTALKDQGAGQDELRAQDAQLRDAFYQTALQLTGNDDAARLLTDRYYGIPDQIDTLINADTGPANAVIDAFKADLANGLALTVPQLGLGYHAAEGGYIAGPGTSTSDSIPARLSNGEYVVKASSVSKYGVGFMESVNAGRFANGGLVSPFPNPIIQPLGVTPETYNDLAAASRAAAGGTPGSGSVGGAWGSIWQWIKDRVPQARINSTYRAGDPGYHGKGKAVDLGFGSAAGGNGSAGLALINRMLFDGLGGNLAELIYDGVGDDRADIKNGRPHSYDASTQAEHHNHVHAAVYGDGTNYVPGDGYAYLHKGEAVVPASQNQGAPYQPQQITLQLDGAAVTRLLEGHVVTALTAVADRGAYNG